MGMFSDQTDELLWQIDGLNRKLDAITKARDAYKRTLNIINEPYWELSHDKIRSQRDHYKKIAGKVLEEYWVDDDQKTISPELDDNF